MLFKSPRQEREWASEKVHPRLRLVMADAAVFMARLGWDPVITDVWRSKGEEARLGSSGVHNVWRAVDVRTRDVEPCKVEDLRRYLEGRWVYDPARPAKVLCYTAEHGNGPHVHVQVTDRTVLRGTA